MNKKISKLISELEAFSRFNKHRDDRKAIEECIIRIINAAVEIYKDEKIILYLPASPGGELGIYAQESRYYLPVYTDLSEMRDPTYPNFIAISLKEACTWVNDQDFLSGIMMDPESEHIFGFEDWILAALMHKGMGMDSFTLYDEESGEICLRI